MGILLVFGIGICVGALIGGFLSALKFYKIGYNDRKKKEYYKYYNGKEKKWK